MTTTEYISSLLSIAAIIIPVFTARLALKDNKKNKQQRRVYMIITVIGVLFSVGLGIFTIGSINTRKIEKFNSFMAQAEMETNKGNYLSAADLYNQAFNSAYNDSSRLVAQYWKGASYFIHALHNNMNDYLYSALREYRQIINQYDETVSEFYIDAIIDSCCVYYNLGYSYTDTNWAHMIDWIEERYNVHTLEGMETLNTTLSSKITMSIALYYDAATTQTFLPGSNTEYLEKAVSAYKSTFKLLSYQNQHQGLNPYGSFEQLYFLQKFCNDMLSLTIYNMGAVSEYDYVTTIVEIIDLCESALEVVPTNKTSYIYIQLNTIIGKANWMLGIVSCEEVKTAFHSEAYKTLMPLVRMQLDPEYEETLQPNAGYYAIFTLCCNEDDIEDIIGVFRKAITKYTPSTNLDNRIDVLTSACYMCEFYLKNYPASVQMKEFTIEIIEELEMMWCNQLTDFDKACIESIREMLG